MWSGFRVPLSIPGLCESWNEMKLTDFVIKDAIIPELTASTKEAVISEMVACLKREELGSTGIGNGVGVPHTKHPAVDQLIATVAVSKNGVDFASLDGEPVFILFLLISPLDRPGDHLRGLENISRHLRGQDFCSFLRQSDSISAIWGNLEEADAGSSDFSET